MNEQLKAVLLLAFGGPESMDEVEPFLNSLMEGRQVPARQVEAVRERYQLIGGGSPLKRITQMQAQALEKALNEEIKFSPSPLAGEGGVRGEMSAISKYKVLAGMAYTEPSIEHAVSQVVSLGIRDITALPISPYYTTASSGRYIGKFEKAVADRGLNVRIIKSYNTNPFFIKAWQEVIVPALQEVQDPFVIFSAHSLPVDTAQADRYVEQLGQTLKLVLKDLSLSQYRLAFQSKGMSGGEWIGPDVKEVMDECAGNGKKNIVVVPLGFVSDHVETLYDIDILYRQHADKLGVRFMRTQSLNTSELFIAALKDVVKSQKVTEIK